MNPDAYFSRAVCTNGLIVLMGLAFVNTTVFSTEVTVSSGSSPRVRLLDVRQGQATGHDCMEAAEIAATKASEFVRTQRMITRSMLLKASDWHLVRIGETNGRIFSPSLGVEATFCIANGELQSIGGCLIKYRQSYYPILRFRHTKWMQTLIHRILVRVALQVLSSAS